MATGGNDLRTETKLAAADLSAKQYHFVRLSAADTVNQASHSAGEDNFGVLQTKPAAANRQCTVGVEGFSKVTAGGSLTVNDLITTNGSGRAAAAASGDMVMGRVLQTAGGDGDIVRCQVFAPYFTGDLA
jgi:hypothetical protein